MTTEGKTSYDRIMAAAEAEWARLYPRRNPSTLTAVVQVSKIMRRMFAEEVSRG